VKFELGKKQKAQHIERKTKQIDFPKQVPFLELN